MHCLHETYFKHKETNRLKIKRKTNTHHTNTSQKKGGMATLISEKLNFRAKNSTTDEGFS